MRADSPQLELTMPDENRCYDVSRLPRCPICGGLPRMDRIGRNFPEFLIRCGSFGSRGACEKKTPNFKSSREAVAHWRMMVLMENQ